MKDELQQCHCNSQNCYCANIKHAEHKITALYNRYLEQAGITRGQYALLVHINEFPCISDSLLAQKMGLERTTLVRSLKPLEERGYILDCACKGRSRSLALSDEGKRVLARAVVCWQQAQEHIEEILGSKYIEEFHDLISYIINTEFHE